jgi:hypothetical protein
VSDNLVFAIIAKDAASKNLLKVAANMQTLHRKVAKQSTATKNSTSALSELGTVAAGLSGSLVNSAASFSAMAVKIGAFASAAQGALMLAGNVATMAGALAVLPAVGLAAGAAIGTLVIGMRGFGDAIKNVGDPEKFAEAIKDLAPAAQATAIAFRDLVPKATELRKAVQESLFAGMADEVKALGNTYLPLLKTKLSGIAAELNLGAKDWTEWARSAVAVKDTGMILDRVKAALHGMAPAGAAISQALTDVAAAGSEFLAGFGSAIGDATQQFAGFVRTARQTGALKEWISEGLSALGDVAKVVGNIAAILRDVWRAATSEGGGFVDLLKTVTGEIRTLLGSAEGMNALKIMFSGISAVGRVLGDVLGEIGRVFITTIAPAIGDLGPLIATGLRPLVGVIEPVGKALAALGVAAGGVAKVLGQLLAEALRILAPIVEKVAPVLGRILEIVGGALVKALQIVGPYLVEFARIWSEKMGPILEKIAPILQDVGKQLGEAIAKALSAIIETMPAFAQACSDLLIAVGPLLPDLIKLGSEILPIMIRALQDIVIPMIQLAAFVAQILIPVVSGLVKVFTEGFQAVGEASRTVSRVVLGALDEMRTAFGTGVQAIKDEAAKIKTSIQAALANPGAFLRAAGQLIIQGLIDGMVSMIPNLSNVLAGITALIPTKKGPEAKDLSMLIPAGQAVMTGFMGGIESMRSALAAQLGAITADVQVSATAGLAGAGSAPGAPLGYMPAASPVPQIIQLIISGNGSQHAEFLVGMLQKEVQVRGGDVQLILGGGQ